MFIRNLLCSSLCRLPFVLPLEATENAWLHLLHALPSLGWTFPSLSVFSHRGAPVQSPSFPFIELHDIHVSLLLQPVQVLTSGIKITGCEFTDVNQHRRDFRPIGPWDSHTRISGIFVHPVSSNSDSETIMSSRKAFKLCFLIFKSSFCCFQAFWILFFSGNGFIPTYCLGTELKTSVLLVIIDWLMARVYIITSVCREISSFKVVSWKKALAL